MKDLVGRTAIVTGGASGIGLGIAKTFGREGMRVIIADIDADRAEHEATAMDGDAIGAHLDVTDAAGWRAMVEMASQRFGGVDVLCNNAGVLGPCKPLVDLDVDRIRRLYEINVMSVIMGIQAVAPLMRARGGGHIVNTASMSSWDSIATLGDYSSSKRAVIGITEAARDELAGDGIGVTALCPGPITTNLFMTTEREFGELDLRSAAQSAKPRNQGSALQPEAVGPMVVDAIRENRLFVFTHAENRIRIERRMEPVWAAFEALSRTE